MDTGSEPRERALRVSTRKRWRRAVYACVATTLFVGALELAIRAIGLDVRSGGPAEGAGWLYHEVRRGEREMNEYVVMGARVYPLTSEFYRIPAPPEPKPAGVERVVCLGDSCTWGGGVEAAEAFPAVLEGMLREAYPGRRIEVWNLGRPGYTSFQGRVLAEREWARLSPDAVVFYFGANDVDYAPIRADKDWDRVPAWSLRTHRFFYRSSALYRLLRNVNVAYLRSKVDHDFREITRRRGASPRVSREDFFANRDALRERTWAGGGRFLTITSAGVRDGRVVDGAYFQDFRAGPDDVDLRALFAAEHDAGREVFLDVVHPNPDGHRLLASEVLTRLAGAAP